MTDHHATTWLPSHLVSSALRTLHKLSNVEVVETREVKSPPGYQGLTEIVLASKSREALHHAEGVIDGIREYLCLGFAVEATLGQPLSSL